MFVHFVLFRIYLQALIVTLFDGSEPRVSQLIRSNLLSWFKWGRYASKWVTTIDFANQVQDVPIVSRPLVTHARAATEHAHSIETYNRGTSAHAVPLSWTRLADVLFPASQVLTTVFPFPISTCQISKISSHLQYLTFNPFIFQNMLSIFRTSWQTFGLVDVASHKSDWTSRLCFGLIAWSITSPTGLVARKVFREDWNVYTVVEGFGSSFFIDQGRMTISRASL